MGPGQKRGSFSPDPHPGDFVGRRPATRSRAAVGDDDRRADSDRWVLCRSRDLALRGWQREGSGKREAGSAGSGKGAGVTFIDNRTQGQVDAALESELSNGILVTGKRRQKIMYL